MPSESSRETSTPAELIAIVAFAGLSVLCIACFFVGGIVLVMYLALIRPVQVAPAPPIPIPTASIRPSITPTLTLEPTFTPTPDPRSQRLDVWTVFSRQDVTYTAVVFPDEAEVGLDFELSSPLNSLTAFQIESIEYLNADLVPGDEEPEGNFGSIQLVWDGNSAAASGPDFYGAQFVLRTQRDPGSAATLQIEIPLDPTRDRWNWTIAIAVMPEGRSSNFRDVRPNHSAIVEGWRVFYYDITPDIDLDTLALFIDPETDGQNPPDIAAIAAGR